MEALWYLAGVVWLGTKILAAVFVVMLASALIGSSRVLSTIVVLVLLAFLIGFCAQQVGLPSL